MLTRQRIVIALVLAIAAGTMISTPGGPVRPFSLCLTCNFRWLADFLANVAMFVPLGSAMNWKRRHAVRTALRSAAFSVCIELIQTTVPGRDPALLDIISNSLGGAFGAFIGGRVSIWLRPTTRVADRLLALTIVVVAAIVGETEWLLAPTTDVTPGPGLLGATAAVFAGQASMAVPTISQETASRQRLFSLGPPTGELLRMSRVSNDALFAYRSRGRELRLDQPEYPIKDFFAGVAKGDTVRISVGRERPGWCLSRTGKRVCGIGPTVGLGWSVLRYPYSLDYRRQQGISIAWTALLFLPVGFWSRRKMLPFALIAAAIILGPFARFTPLLPTPPAEWVGGFVGLGVGFIVGFLTRRSSRIPAAVDDTAREVRRTEPRDGDRG
jgi:hypothetical protein